MNIISLYKQYLYHKNKSELKENYGDIDNPDSITVSKNMMNFFMVLIVINLVIFIFAIYYTMKCARNRNWSGPMVVGLILLQFFFPFATLITIGYGFFNCSGKKDES